MAIFRFSSVVITIDQTSDLVIAVAFNHAEMGELTTRVDAHFVLIQVVGFSQLLSPIFNKKMLCCMQVLGVIVANRLIFCSSNISLLSCRNRSRPDPRGLIEYRDLDAPEDNDL